MKMKAYVRCVLLAALGLTASAQKPTNIELGFKPEQLYQFGSLDSVNLYNGNLLVNLPIGNRYPVSSTLSYQLVLSYNSNMWDYLQYESTSRSGLFYHEAVPNFRSNAGVGWRLSLGRLISSDDPGLRWPVKHLDL